MAWGPQSMVPARAQFSVKRKSTELPAEGNSERLKATSLSLGEYLIKYCHCFYCHLDPLLENQDGTESSLLKLMG